MNSIYRLVTETFPRRYFLEFKRYLDVTYYFSYPPVPVPGRDSNVCGGWHGARAQHPRQLPAVGVRVSLRKSQASCYRAR